MQTSLSQLPRGLNKNQFFHYFSLLRDLLRHKDWPKNLFERRLKRMAMFPPFLENLFHAVVFIVWIPKVTLKWLWNFSVINNFNFLYTSWDFCPVFSFSTFNWKLKTMSIRNLTSTSHSRKLKRSFTEISPATFENLSDLL